METELNGPRSATRGEKRLKLPGGFRIPGKPFHTRRISLLGLGEGACSPGKDRGEKKRERRGSSVKPPLPGNVLSASLPAREK